MASFPCSPMVGFDGISRLDYRWHGAGRSRGGAGAGSEPSCAEVVMVNRKAIPLTANDRLRQVILDTADNGASGKRIVKTIDLFDQKTAP